MNATNIVWELRDNGGRRSGIERRYFSYSDHIPERRNSTERRSREDRRSGSDRRYHEANLINMIDEKRNMSERRST
jgi:hypothetical protein